MKLKKIIALCMAAFMSVSMMSGCGSKPEREQRGFFRNIVRCLGRSRGDCFCLSYGQDG